MRFVFLLVLVSVVTLMLAGCVHRRGRSAVHVAKSGATIDVNVDRHADDAANNCRILVNAVAPAFAALGEQLPAAARKAALEQLPLSVAKLDAKRCDSADQRDEALDQVMAALDGSSGKLGVIIPAGAAYTASNSALLTGLRAAFDGAGKSFAKQVVVRTVAPDGPATERALAQLVLEDRVALVIGGVHRQQAQTLAKWADSIYTPVLLLTGSPAVKLPQAQGFRVFPTQARLADVLARGIAQRGVRSVAFVRPVDGSADALFAALRPALAAQSVHIAGDVSYVRDDRKSLTETGRKLAALNLGPHGGPPLAIIFPDHFRAVRHFVRVLEFNRMEHVLLVGDQQWRSPALVMPQEPRLDGALFGDFVGRYRELPAPLRRRLRPAADDFLPPEAMAGADFGVIGYRAGELALRAVAQEPNRRELAGTLALLDNVADGFFPAGKAFDKGRVSTWPVFLFRVRDTAIEPVAQR